MLDSFDEIERLERIAGERGVRASRADPRHARASPAERTTRSPPARPTRSSASGWTTRAARSSGCAAPTRSTCRACTCTSARSCCRSTPYRPAVEAIATLGDFPVYNLGGGLGVAYTADQQPPTIEEYVEAQVGAAHELLGTGKKLLIEPGRSLVANACVTLYTVQTVKRNVSTWVAVDGGMSDNLRPMLYGAVYEAFIADRAGAAGSGERVPRRRQALRVRRRDRARRAARRPAAGDILVTPATGAYGHAMANNYNGVPRPPVIFCKDGDARVVVRRETYEDLVARDV